MFMAMFLTHAKLRDIFTCIRYFIHSSFSCFFFLIKRYSGLMEFNCWFVLFAGRLTLGGVHGEAEGKSK